MKCEEFSKYMVDLCDKDVHPELEQVCKRHMEECAACKAYYEEYMTVVDKLRPHGDLQRIALNEAPHASLPKKPSGYRLLYRKVGQIAASILLFGLGVWTGLSNFFAADADAMKSVPMVFEQAIKGAKNVGSFVIDLSIRTDPNENLAHIDPNADFIRMKISVLHQNDSMFWRLEKSGGRTIVFDGKEQFLWNNDGLMLRGTPAWGMLEEFASLLHPETLLERQKEAVSTSEYARAETTETDQCIQVTTYTKFYGGGVGSLLKKGKSEVSDCVIENVFTKQDGLLREIRIWIEHGGRRTLVLKSEKIVYNVLLDREQLIRLPETADGQWLEVEDPKVRAGARLQMLQQETATEAARRIMTALVTGAPESAKEALYYYGQLLPAATQRMQGCKVSGFSTPKDKEDYAGVFVFYTLTHPDGTSETRHIALRRDNDQRIWIVDGGL